ncbi:hypothetical protein acdb102_20120 [Acidothermaceae bacterium B102]|nr:hypothetical protein acdb102_20120 [Acidothermaceae bacterium B102]
MPIFHGGPTWPTLADAVVAHHRAHAAAGTDDYRLEAIVFAPAGEEVTETQVRPRLDQLHYESGEIVNLYFPGYFTRDQAPAAWGASETKLRVGGVDYFFEAEAFVEMSKTAAKAFPAWRSRGDCDLLLVLSRPVASLPDDDSGPPLTAEEQISSVFDVTTAQQIKLTQAVRDEAIPSVHEFLRNLIDYAENHQDPRGFMMGSGGTAVAKAMLEWVLSLVPGDARPLWRKTRYLLPAWTSADAAP